MEIFVTKNQQQQGPFTLDDVRGRIASGEFVGSDLGWHKGLADWLPLSQLLASFPVGPHGPPPIPLKSSGFAKASFLIGMIGIGAWVVILGAAAVGASKDADEHSPLLIIAGLCMFAGMAVNLAGVVFGIIGLRRTCSNRWMAITGVVANGLELFAVLSLMVIGLATK
ncbi:MAG: putative rane protein/domain protein [Pedosphaera sp.]|nr:putative rane protein/domain protein [Pedosphaera sp.]